MPLYIMCLTFLTNLIKKIVEFVLLYTDLYYLYLFWNVSKKYDFNSLPTSVSMLGNSVPISQYIN